MDELSCLYREQHEIKIKNKKPRQFNSMYVIQNRWIDKCIIFLMHMNHQNKYSQD